MALWVAWKDDMGETRLRKVVEIGDKEVTILELTVGNIIDLGQLVTGQAAAPDADKADGAEEGTPGDADMFSISGIQKLLNEHLELAVQGATLDDMKKMAPSQLKVLYTTFREVNTVFFEVAQQVGMGDLLRTLQETVRRDFLSSLATL